MKFKNSPLNFTSLDLEIEAIQRFRSLAPFLDSECLVFRELNPRSPVLCLDFTNCPQALYRDMDRKEWQEFAELLLYSSHYLGLANSLVFKNGEEIVGWINFKSKIYFSRE